MLAGPEVGREKFEADGTPKLGDIVPSALSPVHAKYSKSFNLIETLFRGRGSDSAQL
jgi:hypothetical protein